jgi:hypothetical protein
MRTAWGPRPRSHQPLAVSIALAGALGLLVPAAATASGPPPGRAYELVSPADDPGGVPAGVATDAYPMPAIVAADNPDRLVYGAVTSVGEYESGTMNPLVFGRRTPTGWAAVTGVRTTDGGDTAIEIQRGEPVKGWVDPSGTELAYMTGNGLGPPHPRPGGVYNSIYRVGETGLPRWMSAPTAGLPLGASPNLELAASRDLSTMAFTSTSQLTPDAPSGQNTVYAIRNGTLEVASLLPDGSVPTAAAYLANPHTSAGSNAANPAALTLRNVLSPDGRFLVFAVHVATGNSASLYVRDLKQGVTRELASAAGPALSFHSSQAGTWFPGGNATPNLTTIPNGFVTAADNAPIAFFRSAANLAPGATGTFANKIYEANLATGELTYRAPIDGPPAALSADGTKVMFLRPTGATANPWELRFWDAANPDTSVLLGSIPGTANNTGMVRAFRSSDDGRTWVFTAAGSLDPDRPTTSTNPHQLYRWTIGDAAPTCLSCESTDGVARTTGVNLSPGDTHSTETIRFPNGNATTNNRKFVLAQRSQAITSDARLIAFDSPDRLVADDQNDVRDVYLWDADAAPEDRLRLLTSGQGLTPSYYLDMAADGSNVFFATQDGLVEADNDLTYDVYTARVGGGFPDIPDESCGGEECRPPTITPPVILPPGSNLLTTPPTTGARSPVQAGTPKLRVRALRTSSRWIRARIDAPGAGRIQVSGRWVRTVKRTTKRATTYTVRVRLSAAAKRRVSSGKRVKVALRVKFTPKGSKKTSRVSASVSIKKGR